MSDKMDPERGLALLQAERESAVSLKEREEALGVLATTVLRTRGEWVFTKHGIWGGREGAIGRAGPGLLLTQATQPVNINGSYVALRDKPAWPSPGIELLELSGDSLEELRTAGDESDAPVLAVPGQRLQIPGVLRVKAEHEEAVGAVIWAIHEELEPLTQEPLTMPAIGHDGPTRQFINLREHPEMLGDYLMRPYKQLAAD